MIDRGDQDLRAVVRRRVVRVVDLASHQALESGRNGLRFSRGHGRDEMLIGLLSGVGDAGRVQDPIAGDEVGVVGKDAAHRASHATRAEIGKTADKESLRAGRLSLAKQRCVAGICVRERTAEDRLRAQGSNLTLERVAQVAAVTGSVSQHGEPPDAELIDSKVGRGSRGNGVSGRDPEEVGRHGRCRRPLQAGLWPRRKTVGRRRRADHHQVVVARDRQQK